MTRSLGSNDEAALHKHGEYLAGDLQDGGAEHPPGGDARTTWLRLEQGLSDVSKYAVQWRRHLGEIQRVDEQGRVSDLPAAVGADEAPELLLLGPSSPGRLLLEGAERSKLTPSVDEPFHRGGTEGADQLVLQVRDAHVETESLHSGASEVGAEAGPLETAPEGALLGGVTEARQPDV